MNIKKSKRAKPIQMICSQLIKLFESDVQVCFHSAHPRRLNNIVLNLPPPMGRFSDLIGFHILLTANGKKAHSLFYLQPVWL